MTSRERVETALRHEQPDMVPADFGGSATTGMHVSAVYKLRQAYGLDEPDTPVKVVEPYQMLGDVAPDLVDALGIDVLPLGPRATLFGFRNEGWKAWRTFDGTPVLVPEGFNTGPEANGDILMYPEGDRSAPPSGRMPKGGWYFDSIVRQPPLDEAALNVEDNLEEFAPVGQDDLDHFAREAERLETQTDRAVLANFGGTGFGDIALVPAPWLKYPKGIRDVEEWYVSTIARRDHVYAIFERQCEIALANLARVHEVVGERAAAVFVSGTDFGTQLGSFISPDAYRDLYKPFHSAVNGWIHEHTTWKTFIHSCGSVVNLVEDFIEAGFDIMNPVQCSAAGMAPQTLKEQFGDRITFWGGGVDTQGTLPFGSPDDIKREVAKRLRTFGSGGGFVFDAIHNVQGNVPTENLVALFDAFRENRSG